MLRYEFNMRGLFKGTVMQLENALMNDPLGVQKVP